MQTVTLTMLVPTLILSGCALSHVGDRCEPGDCGDALPVCDDTTGVCVECTANSDCPSACDLSTLCCVECLTSADCSDEATPRCSPDTLTCVGCSTDAHCSEADGRPFCVEGVCVRCTAATEASMCGGNSCRVSTGECTLTPIGTVPTCGTCRADSQCSDPDARCVAMNYQGGAIGAFCLRRTAAGCLPPYSTVIVGSSDSGGPSESFCGLDESVTSCEAVRTLLAGGGCTGGPLCTNHGGRCETVGTVANQCTYSCSSASDCPTTGPGSTCGAGYCGS